MKYMNPFGLLIRLDNKWGGKLNRTNTTVGLEGTPVEYPWSYEYIRSIKLWKFEIKSRLILEEENAADSYEINRDQSYQKSFNPEIVIYLLLGFWTLPPSIPPLSGQRDGFIAKERGIPGDQRQLGRSIDRGSLGSLFETRSQGSKTSL